MSNSDGRMRRSTLQTRSRDPPFCRFRRSRLLRLWTKKYRCYRTLLSIREFRSCGLRLKFRERPGFFKNARIRTERIHRRGTEDTEKRGAKSENQRACLLPTCCPVLSCARALEGPPRSYSSGRICATEGEEKQPHENAADPRLRPNGYLLFVLWSHVDGIQAFPQPLRWHFVFR